MKRISRHESGFTLVEIILLLVLVSVISVLTFNSVYTTAPKNELYTASMQMAANIRSAGLGSLNSNDIFWIKFRTDTNPKSYELWRRRGTASSDTQVPFPGGEKAIYLPEGMEINFGADAGKIRGFDRFGRVIEAIPSDTMNPDIVNQVMHINGKTVITLSLRGSSQTLTIYNDSGFVEVSAISGFSRP